MYSTILLKALGYTEQELLDYFYNKEWIRVREGKLEKRLNYDILRGQRALSDLVDPATGKVLVKRGRRISVGAIRQMEQAGIEYVAMEQEELVGKFSAEPILGKDGEEVVPLNGELDLEVLGELLQAGVEEFSVLFIDNVNPMPRSATP